MEKPTTSPVRSLAKKLGFRVGEGTARPTFEAQDTIEGRTVRQFWISCTHIRTRGGESSQSLKAVEKLLECYGESLWGHSDDRPHLLKAGQCPEYPNDIFWPQDKKT